MHYETFIHDRVKLYNEVWEEPVTAVAKRRGVSDVAIHKLCKRLEIPMPPPGYWAKARAGKSVGAKPPLPKISDTHKLLGRKRVADPRDKEIQTALAKAPNRMYSDERVKDSCSNVKVKQNLTNPHPLVQETAEYYKGIKGKGRDGIIYISSGLLDMAVSKDQLHRALRIWNALINTIEGIGFTVANETIQHKWGTTESGTYVKIMDQRLKVNLTESTKRIEHIKTKQEEQSKYAYIPPWDYIPSGILTLHVDDYSASRTNWRDGKRKSLEEQIGDFILALVRIAEENKIRQEIAAKEKQERLVEEKRREEIRIARDRELKRFEALEKAADAWARSLKIERYIEAVSQMLKEENIEGKSRVDIEDWIAWAQQKADWLNPLKQWTDPILGSRKTKEDEPRFLTTDLTTGRYFIKKRLPIVNKRKSSNLQLSRYLGDMNK